VDLVTIFADAGPKQCRRPLNGTSGMMMEICGAQSAPGKSYCEACRAIMYYRPTKQELKTMDAVYGKPIKPKEQGR
jgi:hypothetical protein